jgi:hypothetical protein
MPAYAGGLYNGKVVSCVKITKINMPSSKMIIGDGLQRYNNGSLVENVSLNDTLCQMYPPKKSYQDKISFIDCASLI